MVGQNIGKYHVLDRIGRGGMGTVYRAIDETLHREVAIKVLNAELNDPEVAKRFRAEAITVARLSHPGIATIYELFQYDGQWLMVMEFVRGETLEHMVDRMGSVSPQRTAELCMQALAALAHAHSMGVVHRDLKPANIMITETGAIKIMDFGIARVAGTEHLTSAGFMMGTPAYMAPEQVMGKEIDARADLYAMGVVFYRLTTGKLPFKGDTPFAMAQSQVNDPPTPVGLFRSDLPPWVEQIVVRSLAKSPEERFQSAAEFHEGFARCLAGLSMSTSYSSSAPTELIMTPPRAMPSGSIPRPVTAAVPPLTGPQATGTIPAAPSQPELEPTVLSPTPLSARMPDSPRSLEEALTQATVSGAAPVASGTVPVESPKPAADLRPSSAGQKKTSTGLIAAAAAVLLIGAASFFWFSTRPSPAPPEAPAATTAEAPVAIETPPTVIDPLPETPAPPPSATAKPAPSPPAPGAAVPSRGAASPSTKPATSVASNGAATPSRLPFDDTAVTVPEVKLLIVTGRRSRDEDVTLSFGGGQIALAQKKGGGVLASMPYSSTLRATYIKARDPRWDSTIVGPPENLDVGGVLRTSKHWLVLQSKDAYLILRLEDSNFRQILEAVGTRTNLPIDRPTSKDKP